MSSVFLPRSSWRILESTENPPKREPPADPLLLLGLHSRQTTRPPLASGGCVWALRILKQGRWRRGGRRALLGKLRSWDASWDWRGQGRTWSSPYSHPNTSITGVKRLWDLPSPWQNTPAIFQKVAHTRHPFVQSRNKGTFCNKPRACS